MEQNSYVFRITAMDEKDLPQISYALEKRTELLSREQYPGMWKTTDKLQSSVKESSKGRRIFRTILSICCLCCGVFLFIPGLMEPQELREPLFAGAIGIGTGIGGLLRGEIKRKNSFEKSARLLLQQRQTTDDAKTIFSEGAMTLVANGEEERIPYEKFECVIEAESLFLFTFDGKVIVVKKDDLIAGNLIEFCSFISTHITCSGLE